MSSSPMVANNPTNLPAQTKSSIVSRMRDRNRNSGENNQAVLLNREMSNASLGDRFFQAGRQAASQAGCELLFEVPALLVENDGDRAAAIRCPKTDGDEYFFLVFNSSNGSVAILAQDEVPAMLIAFTRSYAGVLGMIASDSTVTAPLLH